MVVTEEAHRDIAGTLDRAQRTSTPVPQPDGLHGVSAAYLVQHELIDRRVTRGETVVGSKLGFTSRAKMEQMGVRDVIVGQLTDAMAVPADEELDLASLIHPRVEPEIVFRLGPSWSSQTIDTVDDALAAVDGVAAGLEVIDSRYQEFRFNLESVIADNTSAAAFVVGAWRHVRRASDLSGLGVTLRVHEEVVASGSTDDILGNPLESLVALARLSRTYGVRVEPGDIVLAGAATAAIGLRPGVPTSAVVAGFDAVTLATR